MIYSFHNHSSPLNALSKIDGISADNSSPLADSIPFGDCTRPEERRAGCASTFNIPIYYDEGILLEVKYVFMDIPRENFPEIAFYMKSLIL